jgi:CYTH domain-containing protein
MSTIRRFLVAPSLVRLIRKERGGARITEGHFAPQGGRASYVRVDGQNCQLVLVNKGSDGIPAEERTDVPRAHGDALLDVCPGKAAYDRTTLAVAGRDIVIDRYVTPGSLDLISVVFDNDGEAAAFQAPGWFGREVSSEPAFERQALAIQGVPAAEEVPLSNTALDAVLDLIEPRFGFGRYGGSPPRAAEPDDAAVNAMRRIVTPAAPVAAAMAAAAAAPAPEAREPAPPPAPAAEASAEPAPEPHAAPDPAPEPAPAPEHTQQAAAPAGSAAPEPAQGDARIDDVIESLSQALGAAIHQQPDGTAESRDGKGDDPATMFERWTVRPRRTQQQS